MLHLFLLRRSQCWYPTRLRLNKHLSTTTTSKQLPPQTLDLPLSQPTYLIWGSNTAVGKTLVSAGLASSSLIGSDHPLSKFLYIKPIQTGFPSDSDSRFVFQKLAYLSRTRNPHIFPVHASNHILNVSFPAAKSILGSHDDLECGSGMYKLGQCDEWRLLGKEETHVGSRLICKTIYAWEEAVSPHLAAEREGGAVKDSDLLESLQRCLSTELGSDGEVEKMRALCVIETAGGIASPGPSGSLQCDLYRPFRLPGVLVGDGRLGGISGTISAYETLKLRGYDISAIILVNNGLQNEVPILSYLRNRVPVLVLPPLPLDISNDMMEWFDDSRDIFDKLKETMLSTHSERVNRLRDMPKKAREVFWWPFTQHKLVSEEGVTVIDSRCGENFAVFKGNEMMTQHFDACASWWTQGPDAALQTELAREMGYAAARFGHVMFPENVYEPALKCTELLLEGVGKGWASRTYFSDNGSTAIEIALKMAFRKFCFDRGIHLEVLKGNAAGKNIELMVLALNGSYHGDTLGAMEAQAPSCYTGFLQQPWHTGRGIFLDPPTVYMSKGKWDLSFPMGLQPDTMRLENTTFNSCDEIFDKNRDNTELARIYSAHLSNHLSHYSEPKSFLGALIMEPVIQGAGGMHMVDPLFQRLLVKECRSRSIPVIFDEVFTGFWRLGTETAANLLHCVPDIACYAKLMTGGTIPLATTLATKSVYDSFIGDSKLEALLHGHSYSAHAVGCTAAVNSIKWFKDPQTNPNIDSEGMFIRDLWDEDLVYQISLHPVVQRVVSLGTLCALELRADGSDAGYASVYARSLLLKLHEDGIYMRPLGNVIYLMCGPCTSPKICKKVLTKLYARLDKFSRTKESEIDSESMVLAQ